MLAYRARLRRALPRRRSDAALLRRLGGWGVVAGRLPDRTDAERGRIAAGALAGALLLAASSTGWRAAGGLVLGGWLGARGAIALGERGRRARHAEARAALPVTLDRLTTCVLAGMSVERALRTVAHGTTGPLGEALRDGLRALDVGVPRAEVYARIAARADLDELRAVLAALARAERFGTSVGDALVAHADELRARARAAAEAEARTAPVKLIFPLVLCFLPAFVLLTIAPIALSAVRTLSGI